MRVDRVAAVTLAALLVASCRTPPDLAGEYVGAGTESAALTGAPEAKTWSRAPLDEHLTITRVGVTRDLHIKYGSCELPARGNPDGQSATVVYGKCWVTGFPGPIPVEGTFAFGSGGSAMNVHLTGTLPGATGNVRYSYEFTGVRAPR